MAEDPRGLLAVHPRQLRAQWLGRQGYAVALSLQESLVTQRISDEVDDQLLLLEHEHVYTLGRGADEQDLLEAPQRLGVATFRVGRGGGVTYHGPGQLVGYPIIRLIRQDVQRHVHLLEDALIATCAHLGVAAARRPDAIGVWVGAEKIASIGVGVRRGVTYHGVALNVACDLAYFGHVVPCRESALRFTSLARLLATAPTVEKTALVFRDCFAAVFGYTDVTTVGV